jgi:hypothetical protein
VDGTGQFAGRGGGALHPPAVHVFRRALCASPCPFRSTARSPAPPIAGGRADGPAPARARCAAPQLPHQLCQPPVGPTRRAQHPSGPRPGAQGRPSQPLAAVCAAACSRVSAGAYPALPRPAHPLRKRNRHQHPRSHGGAAGQPDSHQRRARQHLCSRCGIGRGVPAMLGSLSPTRLNLPAARPLVSLSHSLINCPECCALGCPPTRLPA